MNVSDFDYELPEELIAQRPCDKRDESRLLVVDRKTGEIFRMRQELADLESDVSRRPVYEQTIGKLEARLDVRKEEILKLRAETDSAREELRQLAVMQRSAEDFTLEEEELRRLEVDLDTLRRTAVSDTLVREIRFAAEFAEKVRGFPSDPETAAVTAVFGGIGER